MLNPEMLVTRFLRTPEDLDLLKKSNFCETNVALFKPYPKHKEWFQDRALPQIQKGIRLAVGVFFERRDQDVIFVGSMILKGGRYTNELEIKNILTYGYDKNFFGDYRVIRNSVVDKLLAQAEIFCSERNFSKIYTETVSLDSEPHYQAVIMRLVGSGFRLTATTKNRYYSDIDVYHFEKGVDGSYLGDPFDFQNLAEWILYDCIGFEGCDETDTGVRVIDKTRNIGYSYSEGTFKLAPKNPPSQSQKSDHFIRGGYILIDNHPFASGHLTKRDAAIIVESVREKFQELESKIRFLFIEENCIGLNLQNCLTH